MVDVFSTSKETEILISEFKKLDSHSYDFKIEKENFYFNEKFLESLRESIEDFQTAQGITTELRLDAPGVFNLQKRVDKSLFRELLNAIIRRINYANTYLKFDEKNELFFEGEYFNADPKDIEYHDEKGIELYKQLIEQFTNISKRLESGETPEQIAESVQSEKKPEKDKDDKEKLAQAVGVLAGNISGPTSQPPQQTGGAQDFSRASTTLTAEQIKTEENVKRSLRSLMTEEVARETVIIENLILNTYDLSKYGITDLPPGLDEVIRAQVRESLLNLDITKFVKSDGTLDRTKIVTLRAQLIRKALPAVMQNSLFQIGLAEVISTNERDVQLAIEEEVFNKSFTIEKALDDETFLKFFKEKIATEAIRTGKTPQEIISQGKYGSVFLGLQQGRQGILLQDIEEQIGFIQTNTEPANDPLSVILRNSSVKAKTADAIFSDGTVILELTNEFIERNGRSPIDLNELINSVGQEYREFFDVLLPLDQARVFTRFAKMATVVIEHRASGQPINNLVIETKDHTGRSIKINVVSSGTFFQSTKEGEKEEEIVQSSSRLKDANLKKEMVRLAAKEQLKSQETRNEVVNKLKEFSDLERRFQNRFDWEKLLPEHVTSWLLTLSPLEQRNILEGYLHDVENAPSGLSSSFQKLQQLVSKPGHLTVEDLEKLFGDIDISQINTGGRTLTVDHLLRLSDLTADQRKFLEGLDSNGIKHINRILGKRSDVSSGGLLESDQKIDAQLHEITTSRKLIEASLQDLLKANGIDGSGLLVIEQLLGAYALTGTAITDLPDNIDALFRQYGGKLQFQTQELERQIEKENKKFIFLKDERKIKQLSEEIYRNNTLYQTIKLFRDVLVNSDETRKASQEFLRQKKNARPRQLAEEISNPDFVDLLEEEQVAQLLAINEIGTQDALANALFEAELDNARLSQAEINAAQQVRSQLYNELSDAERERLQQLLILAEGESLRDAFVRQGFNYGDIPTGSGDESTFSRLRNWRDRIKGLQSLRAQATKKLAKKLAQSALKSVALPLLAGGGVGFLFGQLSHLIGQGLSVAGGIGAGAGLGFLIGGPVGAVVGAIAGGVTSLIFSSQPAQAAATQGVVNVKALTSDLANSAGKMAQSAGKTLIEGGANTFTTKAFSSTLNVPVAGVVGGTVAGVGALGAFTLMTVLGSFLPDASSQFVGAGESSPYIEIRKTASPTAINNNEEKEITYKITLTPKNGYTISPTNVSDILSFLGGDVDNGRPQVTSDTADLISDGTGVFAPINNTDSVIQAMEAEGISVGATFSEPKTLTYNLKMKSTDVLVTNKFKLEFTATKDAETATDDLTRSTSVRIGNPKVGCFEFGPAGFRFPGGGSPTSKEWLPEEEEKILRVFAQRAGTNADFVSMLCNRPEPITIYRLPGSVYGGWAPGNTRIPNVGNFIGIYDLGIGFTDLNTEYTLIHEFGHILDYRNAGLRQKFNQAKTTQGCFTYPYGCDGDYEAFAEGFVLYVIYTNKTFSDNLYDFKGRWPTEFNWFKQEVFGGLECDTNSCTVQ